MTVKDQSPASGYMQGADGAFSVNLDFCPSERFKRCQALHGLEWLYTDCVVGNACDDDRLESCPRVLRWR